ncbi:hypothetical protein SAMN02745221_01530 [Thermosyntropha lipolytica DSM 11003]|uniref:Uncharacterized protein n=1 Tax=Thermosyntropha lipolytica DSM 11003 TaxID=1123382 RepID=A0A1M5PR21_9FIRM|nr:hypothetical protein [Thermosyntropha lipolytica]SHH03753.1 hypothetical protein SAMN02745221_01530 [Thermosyntropha lipolytica DSM 11003]
MPGERIKDLRELQKYRERFKENEWIDSLSLFKPTGARLIGEDKNLFIYHFDRKDVEDFLYIYRGIDGTRIDEGFAIFFKAELADKCEEMNRKRVCPIECMLYASKAINKFIANRYIYESIAEVAAANMVQWEEEGKEVVSHILHKWHWLPQLKIAIEIVRITRDIELLKLVYRIYGMDESLKTDVFKALIESGHRELLIYVFNMARRLQKNTDKDRYMLNLWEKNFYRYMPESVNDFENFLSSPGVSNYVYNRINNLLAQYKTAAGQENNLARDTKQLIFELSNKANPGSSCSFQEREQAFEELIGYLKNKALRKQVFFALRNTRRPEAALYIMQTLKSGDCKPGEIKDALVTLGFLNYKDDDHFLSRNFSCFDIAMWTYYYLSGKEEYLSRLIEHFLAGSEERAGEIISYLNQFYGGRRTEIQKIINEQFVTILRERKNEDIIKAADNISRALDKLQMNDLEASFAEIFRVFGFENESSYGLQEEEVFLSLLEMTGRYYVKNFNKKNGKKLERFLFYITENYEGKVKNKALKILKSVDPGGVGK